MNNLLTKILNAFALGAGKRFDSRLTTTLVLGIVGFCLMLCAWMGLYGVKDKFVFMVDAVEIGGADSVTIGRGSDVSFAGVPADYLCVKAQPDGTMTWRKNAVYTDSLQYIKINNANPNVHPILNDTTQHITVDLPYAITPDSRDSVISITLTGADVWRAWRDFPDQQNVLLRHLATHHRLATGADSTEAARLRRQIEIGSVRSFFNASHSSLTGRLTAINLVIIDNKTRLDGQGYTESGTTAIDGQAPTGREGLCKVQFFNIATSRYCTPGDDGGFQIDGVNYTMKTTPLLSEWGAGHTMIRRTDSGMRVVFPKAIGYVGSIDSLRRKSALAAGLITFRQSGTNFPSSTDLYLPQFSNAFGQDICNVEFSRESDSIYIHDSNSRTVAIAAPRFSLLPTLRPIKLHSGSNVLECRVGVINGAFVMSYLWLPLFTILALIFVVLGPWSPFRLKNPGPGIYSARQLRRFPVYLSSLLAIAFVYCTCKSLIALKLSYTYPYFEKITAITPVATTLMVIVAFTLILIFNHGLIAFRSPRRVGLRAKTSTTPFRAWMAWGVTAGLFALAVYAFFGILDQQVSRAVIESYFRSEMSYAFNEFSPITQWWSETAYGVNDNHRTIPYMLITIEALLLVVAALSIAFSQRLLGLWSRVEHLTGRLSDAATRMTYAVAALFRRKPTKRAPQTPADAAPAASPKRSRGGLWAALRDSAFVRALPLVWSILWPGHILLLILIVVVSTNLGNFGTAFITLCVVVALSRALTNVRIADPNSPDSGGVSALTALFAMLIIAVIYMIGAMVADNGYLTNFLGFIMALLCFFNVMKRPGFHTRQLTAAAKHERFWTYALTVFATALVVLLPIICSHLFTSDEANYSRSARRIRLYSDFDNIQQSGFRYDESDAEFMVIMSHYLQADSDGDALSNDSHPLHPSVSTGQSPVVLNDLSVPVAFFGAYGVRIATTVYFLLLLALIILVIHFSMGYDPERGEPRLTRSMQWRMLAVFMWVGTSYYIYFSYIGWIPFTGRLNPGFGVDAVGEALESAILLAYMGTVTVFVPKDDTPEN